MTNEKSTSRDRVWADWKLSTKPRTTMRIVYGFRFLEDSQDLTAPDGVAGWRRFIGATCEGEDAVIELPGWGEMRPVPWLGDSKDLLSKRVKTRLSQTVWQLFDGTGGVAATVWKLKETKATGSRHWSIGRTADAKSGASQWQIKDPDIEVWMFPVGIAYVVLSLDTVGRPTSERSEKRKGAHRAAVDSASPVPGPVKNSEPMRMWEYLEAQQELLIRDARTRYHLKWSGPSGEFLESSSLPVQPPNGDAVQDERFTSPDRLLEALASEVLRRWRRSSKGGNNSQSAADNGLEAENVLRSYSSVYVSPDDEGTIHEHTDLLQHLAERMKMGRTLSSAASSDSDLASTKVCEYMKGSYFGVSREGSVMLSVTAHMSDSNLWESRQSSVVSRDFFNIYLLTIMQRDAMDELRRRAAIGFNNERHIERLQAGFVSLIARGYFSSISVRSDTVPFENMLRSVLRIDQAYEAAVTITQIICETSISKYEREENRSAMFWQVAAGFAILPSLYLTFMNVNIKGVTDQGVAPQDITWHLIIAMMLGLILAIGCITGVVPAFLQKLAIHFVPRLRSAGADARNQSPFNRIARRIRESRLRHLIASKL